MTTTPSNSLHMHVPTPGDHYSPATGSAVMTIIHELARNHLPSGETRIIVGHNTRHDYPTGTCVEVTYPSPLPPRHKLADALAGKIGLSRPFVGRLYRPACGAVPDGFDGPLFVHNAPGALPHFRR